MNARKTFPVPEATSSMRSAREPANTVPNPLFSPLHMVAPVDQYKLIVRCNKIDYIYMEKKSSVSI
jgi:hypothetical protein